MKWSNSSDLASPIWKSHDEIDQKINVAFIILLVKNNYFDFNNFESPVNKFYQREDIFLRSDTFQFIELNAKKNDYELKDSLTQFTQQEGTFYSFQDNKKTMYQANFVRYMSLRFGIDSEHETYERTVYSFWEFIGLIGGIYEIVDVFFALFVSTYNNKMFLLEVINKKIKVITNQAKDDCEKLTRNRNRLLMEENNQQDMRPSSDNQERSQLRNRKPYLKESVKEFTITDSLKECVWFCSKSSK